MTTNIAAKVLSVFAAAALVGMVGFSALAQEKPATPPKTEKKVKPAPSPCKNLDETTCKGKSECGWTKASKNAEGKETRKAYCHLKRRAAKKSEKTEK